MTLAYIKPEKRYGKILSNHAKFFRALSLKIDENPDIILYFRNHPALQFILSDSHSSTYERTQYLEAFAYGDPGALLASPGPSLSGLIIRELGTDEQIEQFYRYIKQHSARTFFALTEPTKGSDAANILCRLTPSDHTKSTYYLNGEKCLFGNGAIGQIGVVLAKTHPGPLGMTAILITEELLVSTERWITRHTLPLSGLRGAQIAYMSFNNCPINRHHILGQHKGLLQRGMMAVIKTFNRLRSGVGALAIGQAQAVLDYVYENKSSWNKNEIALYNDLFHQLTFVRTQLLHSSQQVDTNVYCSFNTSLSKLRATELAENVMTTCIDLLGGTCLLDNPWLAKCYRDIFAFEYMEGTSTMQLQNIYRAYLSNMNQNV